MVIDLDAHPFLQVDTEISDGFRVGDYLYIDGGVEEEDVLIFVVAEALEFCFGRVKYEAKLIEDRADVCEDDL